MSSITVLSSVREVWLITPGSNVHHVANKESTWVPPAPDGPHVGPMNLAVRDHLAIAWGGGGGGGGGVGGVGWGGGGGGGGG